MSELIEGEKPKKKGKFKGKRCPGRTYTELSTAERVFCAEYLANGFNGSLAVSSAWPRISDKSRSTYSMTVLKRPRVKKYLSDLINAKLEASGLSSDRLLRKLEAIIWLDPLDLFQPGGIDGVYELKSLDDVPKEVRECISKLKMRSRIDSQTGDTEVYIEVELMSKDKALELAMKYHGMLGGDSININLNANRPRIDFDELCEPPDLKTIEGTVVSK